MPRPYRHHWNVYHSRWHMLVSLCILIIPFVFLLLFALGSGISVNTLFSDIGISVWRLFIAYFIAVAAAWLAAVSFYRGARAKFALPLFDVLQSFPTFAALPLAVTIWGRTNFTVIFFLVITIVWPLFFSIISSLKLIKPEWYEAALIARLPWKQYLNKFLLPVTIPGVVTGTIIGLGEGWEALVATEIIANIHSGLGSFFSGFSNNVTLTALGITGLLLLIFSINKLVWLPLLDWSHARMEE